MANENKTWLERNTFHHSQFWDLLKLIKEKEKKNLRISLCIPTLNEEKTIGKEIVIFKSELMNRYPLVDEFAVIDSGSTDKTREIAAEFGADVTINTRKMKPGEARKVVKAHIKKIGWPLFGHKILEMSGTPVGQELAWGLMSFAGVVGMVGFCLDRIPVRLSNLMAFDADAFETVLVDISFEPRDGDETHSGASIVRGALTDA